MSTSTRLFYRILAVPFLLVLAGAIVCSVAFGFLTGTPAVIAIAVAAVFVALVSHYNVGDKQSRVWTPPVKTETPVSDTPFSDLDMERIRNGDAVTVAGRAAHVTAPTSAQEQRVINELNALWHMPAQDHDE